MKGIGSAIVQVVVAVAGTTIVTAHAAEPATGRAAGTHAGDTTGSALIEWSYDTWTVPWVQVREGSQRLDPASHGTLMTVACENSILERDRKVRHMSPEYCEHRMAEIRTDHDTALVIRLELRVIGRKGASEPAHLGSRTTATLEADDGWRWAPVDLGHGLSLGTATSGETRRISIYRPQWMRGSEVTRGAQGAAERCPATEYWIRFPRRDPKTGRQLLTPATRWLRLRLASSEDEWVATWPFIPDEVRAR